MFVMKQETLCFLIIAVYRLVFGVWKMECFKLLSWFLVILYFMIYYCNVLHKLISTNFNK